MNTLPSPDPSSAEPSTLAVREPSTRRGPQPVAPSAVAAGQRRRPRPTEHPPVDNPDPLLSVRDLATLFSVSEETARRIARTAGFPSVYVLSTRALRWRRSEVEEWIETRRKQSRTFASDVPEWLLNGQCRGPRRANPVGGAA
jgi:predicted DNA-binding transcriptional regulator AlpA